ncbi:TPA: hypothetical protein U1B14_000805 [Streptococcus suis]|uniref:EutP/PduV family microcompartment system protein n=1 Tax=Streptococcus TaxID=1301 RepID=UPI000E0C7A90|nr:MULTISPECIES: EutP/PduV family microcompartment system protein [Streptococcus]AXI67368.1 hypothetical protein DP112_04555 [Streptococcus suis]MBY0718651.1 EutP/PduV family microcompartment system protein [Streptococcus sp. 2018110]MCB2860198.1 hypothetical protein [Streptococcus suis]MCB2868736.1 hypothetical protein [Streptococcus suis]MCO8191977.1 EutP/PduV family microcompartment system protein [Streptococcus suis]
MKKRILVVGPEDSGKREVIQFLEGRCDIKLIESIVYGSRTIYVPDSYLRSPGMKKHIIATQQNAYCIVMLLPSDRNYRVYSPNFAQVFRIPSLGVIVYHSEQLENNTTDCLLELRETGVNELIELDLENNDTYVALLEKIKKLKEGNQ